MTERYKIEIALTGETKSLSVGSTAYSTELKKQITASAGWYTEDEFHHAGGVVTKAEGAQIHSSALLEFWVTKEEFENTKKYLWVWCDPHGEGSVRIDGSKFFGRIHIPYADLKKEVYGTPNESQGSISGKLKTKTDVKVTESALHYAAFAMRTLAADPLIQKIKDAPQGNEQLFSGDNKRGAVAALGVPSDTSGQIGTYGAIKSTIVGAGASAFSSLIPKADVGKWDLKPQISKVWGDKIRLGNEIKITQDRHLSNISYGFLCAAAGLTWQQAMRYGFGPGYPYVQDNETPVIAGHALYLSVGANVTAKDLMNLIEAHANTGIFIEHDDFRSVLRPQHNNPVGSFFGAKPTYSPGFDIYKGDTNQPTPPGTGPDAPWREPPAARGPQ